MFIISRIIILEKVRKVFVPCSGWAILACHEHLTIIPDFLRFIHGLKKALSDGRVSRFDDLNFLFSESEPREEEFDYRFFIFNFLSTQAAI